MTDKFTDEEIETKKQAIFDAMGKRGRKQILKKGYAKWDPFQEPKDPIDIRRDKTRRTTTTLIREFLAEAAHEDSSGSYEQGALEVCLGMVNDDEKARGMFEFSCWYRDLLRKEGHELP